MSEPRESFEKWAADIGLGDNLVFDTSSGYVGVKDMTWQAWQAAQAQASKPIAAVTGWYDGRCVIEPLDRALAIPVGMALYSQPQAQAGDGEAVAEIQEYKHWLFCDNGERDGFEWRKRQVNNGDLLSLPHGTKLYTHQQPSVNRQDLIDLLIATRTQSEGVTADLIIKMLDAPPAEVNQQLLEALQVCEDRLSFLLNDRAPTYATEQVIIKARAAIAAAQEQK